MNASGNPAEEHAHQSARYKYGREHANKNTNRQGDGESLDGAGPKVAAENP